MALHAAPEPSPPGGPSGREQNAIDPAPQHSLKGVRFAALKAPGPTGTRAEHMSELLGVRRKRVASKGMRALGSLLEVIEAGGLPEEARWVAFTKTVLIEKKVGPAPRTIKIGEALRATSAQRVLKSAAAKVRPTLVRMRQWGVSLPGGCESLIHWRSSIE